MQKPDQPPIGLVLSRTARAVSRAFDARLAASGGSLPVWLIASAIGFSIFVSLAAGLYPARRAARLDPIHALRHD